MALIQFEKFNLNNFYDKTPKPLKYILIISLIVFGSYILFSKKVSEQQVVELAKIEQSIETTYQLIEKFDEFKTAQYIYNGEVLDYLQNIYTLVEELNSSTNAKFNALLNMNGKDTEEIIERLTLLNESFEKLQKAYTPDELETPDNPNNYQTPKRPIYSDPEIAPIDKDGNYIGPPIKLNKIE